MCEPLVVTTVMPNMKEVGGNKIYLVSKNGKTESIWPPPLQPSKLSSSLALLPVNMRLSSQDFSENQCEPSVTIHLSTENSPDETISPFRKYVLAILCINSSDKLRFRAVTERNVHLWHASTHITDRWAYE